MNRIKELLIKYRELILYLIFGVLTTLVNLLSYTLLARGAGVDLTLSTALAWLISVVFAYLTNRKWVFKSRAAGFSAIFYELWTFFGGRAFSGLLDVAIMFLFAERMGFNDLVVKILSNILVILLNYMISKWIVFRKRGGQ